MSWIQKCVFLAMFIFSCAGANALHAEERDTPVIVSIVHEEKAIQPGRPFWAAVHIDLADNWHSYWKNPGDAGMAPQVIWKLPEGFTASPILWPVPDDFSVESVVGYGYEGDVLLMAEITPPSEFKGTTIELGAEVTWLVCSDANCVPGNSEIKVDIPVISITPEKHLEHGPLFIEARNQLPKEGKNIEVYRTEQGVEVHLPSELTHLKDVLQFFPEDSSQVDTHVNPVVKPIPDSDRFMLVLKSGEMPSSKNLKGLVVDKSAEIVSAYEINAPILDASPIILPEVTSLMMAVILAFVGGAILNLMPCVLPVMSFKVLGFIKMAKEDRFEILKHGLIFSLGILVSFWVLASMLLILQAYGQSAGWGFQLQEPLFVGILAAILFVVSLSLLGIFELGLFVTKIAGAAQGNTKKEGLKGSFFSGILATALATPCTGPFLGSAVGFAMTVSAPAALLIFTSLGIGMAFPYIALSAFPNFLRYLPKPGPWMETFKQLTGFVVMATVLWLTWVFSAQTNSFSLMLLLVALFALAIGSWIHGRWGGIHLSKKVRRIAAIGVLLFGATAGSLLYIATTPAVIQLEETSHGSAHSGWEVFSPERVAELVAEGKPVFVDFTAKWCLICQANHLVLTSDAVNKQFAELGVVKMKADWTKNDAVITKELQKQGRSGVPLYLLYTGKSKNPEILPQVLTPDVVINHLQSIK